MDLAETIAVNTKILKLIQSKYGDSAIDLESGKGKEGAYYRQLKADCDKAFKALKNGGIAPVVDDNVVKVL